MMNSKAILQRFILTGMQLCWIYAVFSMINIRWFDGKVMFFPLLTGFLSSLGLSVILSKKVHSKLLKTFAVILAGVFYSLLLGWYSTDLAQICMGISLWVMGWWQERGLVDLKGLFVEFQMGFGILFVVFFTEYHWKIHLENSFLIVCGFFILALCGLAISKMNENHESGIGISGNIRLMYLIISLVFIFFLAGIILLAVHPKMIELFFSLVVVVKNLILSFMDLLVRLFPSERKDLLRFAEYMKQVTADRDMGGVQLDTGNIRSIWRFVYIVGSAGFGFTVLWQMSRMFLNFLKRKYISASQISHESLQGAFRADVILAVKQIYRYLAKLCVRLSKAVCQFILKYGSFSDPDSVREIYEKMLKWSSKKGFGRRNYQTPCEHKQMLIDQFDQTRDSLSLITGVYARHRYGMISASSDEQIKMQEAWRCLKKIKLRSSNKGE